MKLTILIAILTTTITAFAQSHGHINAGAMNTNGTAGINTGDKLFMYFESGTQLTKLNYNSGSGVSGGDGFLWNGYTTFTALHQSSTPSSPSGYDSLGALSGSFLTLNLVSIAGPVGAQFAFYEGGGANPLWVYEIGTGLVAGSGSISLTQQSYFEGSPGDGIPSDPFGHIHGRTFGVNTAGNFTITWTLKDTQSATTGMLDSDSFTSSYTAVAVPEPSTWLLVGVAAMALLANSASRFRSRH